MAEDDRNLLRTFQYEVSLRLSLGTGRTSPPASPDVLGDGGFQECSGLEVQLDVVEYLEGGRNDGVIRQVGRAKYQNIVLKRGMLIAHGSASNRTVLPELWLWIQGVASGVRPVARYDGVIDVLSGAPDKAVVARWVFDRGLPARVVGPQLNAKTGEIAIEELHIAHEGLRLAPVT